METEIKYRRSTAWFSLVMTFLTIGFIIFLITIWIMAAILAIVMLFLVLQFTLETLTLKKNHVLLRLGIISLNLHEVPYKKINSISIKQGLFGRIFNYGNLVISVGNDTSKMTFDAVEDPHKVKKQINHLKELDTRSQHTDKIEV